MSQLPSLIRHALLTSVLMLLSACAAEPSPPLDQQVYVWQRQWRAEHVSALQRSRADFSTLRVLALQAHPQEGWSRIRIDDELLKADGRPLIAVVRLDGQLPQLDQAQADTEIEKMLADWHSAGLQPVGLEIDHDCATARLPAYATFLAGLRRQLPADMQLSITALPAWLDSPALPSLLANVDDSVLQVHAVTAPGDGLFDPDRALQWARRWSRQTPQQFHLALPAYGIGVLNAADGSWLVESEATLDEAGPRRELMADPQQLAQLLQVLQRDPPSHLAGVIWFRLPLSGDKRAWPLPTLQAVVRGEPLRAGLRVERSGDGPLYEFALINDGTVAGPLPLQIRIAGAHCAAGDGLAGYRLQRDAVALVWARTRSAQLNAGARVALGWARCESMSQGALDVSF